jgi:FkbM family methyltransferase
MLTSAAVIYREGFGTWQRLRRLSVAVDRQTEPISIHNLKYPIQVRPGSEDINTIVSTVVREEYGNCSFSRPPRFMIDAGAFIGDTAAYFLSRFSDLTITALEPNIENFSLARSNLAPYGDRVRVLHSALGDKEGTAYFAGQATSGLIGERGIPVPVTTVPDLMKQYSIPKLDILKLDIEGAEAAVLGRSASDWLQNVGNILVEIHGSDIEREIISILTENRFVCRQFRSVWYCENRAWR